MGYLICDKCEGYYELQDGESPEDFDVCECGGRLRYAENLNSIKKEKLICPSCGVEIQNDIKFCGNCGKSIPLEVKKSTQKSSVTNQGVGILKELKKIKGKFLNSSFRTKIISTSGIFVLFILVFVILSGSTAATQYNDDNISFDYPKDWKIGFQDSGEIMFDYPSQISRANIMIFPIQTGYLETLENDGFTKKTLNGYTYYEKRSTGGTKTLNTGIFVKDKNGWTIVIAGDKDQANNAFNMIINSFRIQ